MNMKCRRDGKEEEGKGKRHASQQYLALEAQEADVSYCSLLLTAVTDSEH